MPNILALNIGCIIILLCIGLYTMLVAKNLLRILIGYEIMAKAVTLAVISAGYANGKMQFAQSLVITVVVLEVVFIAIAIAIVMLAQRTNKSLNVSKLTNLKG